MKKMMNALKGATALAVLALTLCSCVYHEGSLLGKDGPIVTDNRQLAGFEKIQINGWPTVEYTQSDSFLVAVEGPDDKIDLIETSVRGKILVVSNKGKVGILNFSSDGGSRLVVRVSSPDLTDLTLNGSGDFVSRKRVDTDKMNIVLRGSGDITMSDLICDECSTELVGSGDIDLDRLEAQKSSVRLVGSGDIDIRQWHVDETDIRLTGSGDIDVDFVEGCRKATCSLTGSGDIELKGRIGHLSKQKGGSGDIDTDKLTIEK